MGISVHISQLRTFVALVEAGSVRAGARQLGVSQPAATKALRALEKQLDATLVQRTSRGVALTEAGKAFLLRAKSVIGELRDAQEELARLAGARSETVRIGVATVIGPWLIPPALASFRAEVPDCVVRIVEGTQDSLLPLLRQGELDFAVCLRLDEESTRGFTTRPLARLRLTVVGRKGHPLRNARTLKALADAHWILSRPHGTGGVLERAFKAAGLPVPAWRTECESQAIKMALMANSDALGVLGNHMLGERLVAAHFQEIALDKPLPLMTFCVYSRADGQLGPEARAFVAAIARQARSIMRTER
jgi:DNA-binding transcriptional LysR family regulator